MRTALSMVLGILFWGVLAFASDNGNLSYSSRDLFPLPKQLEPAVQFWVKVYTQYHTNEYILHDANNLNVIYEVVRLGKEDDEVFDVRQTRSQKRFIDNRRKYYQNLLRKLASRETNLDKLEGDLLRIYNLFGQSKNRSVYRVAASNIRVQKGQRNRFRHGLEISGLYKSYMEDIFRKHQLPLELTVLPHVESSFNYKAYSSAGAAGMWQFTRRTGRRFLKISYEIDERLDPILSTIAAARVLKENYEELGSWPLAITAYNHGLAGMKRAKRKLKTTDIARIVQKYRSRTFKFASRNFYCEFLAALHVVQNYKQYFGEIRFEAPLQFKEFVLPHYVKASTLANAFQLDLNALKKYNPALRRPIFEGQKYVPQHYRLRLPIYLNPEPLYASIPKDQLFLAQKRSKWYRVRRGDTLSEIARRYRTSVRTLMAINNMRNAHRIRAGEVLRLPEQRSMVALSKASSKPASKGETVMADISSSTSRGAERESGTKEKVDASPEPPKEPSPNSALPMRSHVEITPPGDGATLISEIQLVESKKLPVGFIRVEPEETLGHYADWLQIPTQQIRNWNHLDFGESIQIGQKIKLIFSSVSPEQFLQNRLEYHRGIEEDFFNHFQIVGTSTHKVKRGENIWFICNSLYNLPYWLIKSYNTDMNLTSLKPGDTIVIPEVAELGESIDDTPE